MAENIQGYLVDSIPPGCVCTRTNKGLESMYFTHQPNNLTKDPILHIRESAVINLQTLKKNVIERKLEIIYNENEWLIYKALKK